MRQIFTTKLHSMLCCCTAQSCIVTIDYCGVTSPYVYTPLTLWYNVHLLVETVCPTTTMYISPSHY